MGPFGLELFRPWVVSARGGMGGLEGGTLIFSAYVGLVPSFLCQLANHRVLFLHKKNSLEQVIPSIVPVRIENELSVYFADEMCTKIKIHFNFTRKPEVFSILFEILVNPRVLCLGIANLRKELHRERGIKTARRQNNSSTHFLRQLVDRS